MIDYETKDAPDFTPTPEGEHEATITETSVWDNPNGPDKIKVKFALLDGSEHVEFINPQIMKGDGWRIFADLLSIISDSDTLPESGTFDEQDLVGLECMITIKHTIGTGKHKGKTFANMLKIEELKKKT